MNIKRYIATIILAIVLLLNFSCTDWLDVKPVDRMSEDQLYSTEAGFRQALNGIYVELNHADLYGDELLVNTVEILAQRYKFSSIWRNSIILPIMLRNAVPGFGKKHMP